MTPQYPDWLPRRGAKVAFVFGAVVAAGALTTGTRAVAAFLAAGSLLGLALAGVCFAASVALFERTLHVRIDRRFGVAAAVAVVATVLSFALLDVPPSAFEELAR